ncbi:CCCH-type Zn-finger protein [Forsythia ovata]|uniref:CCCH-type Zn-finger protein n=1 Tax=Forsythia ovata TaxID=205694 RepID=A0ABD1P3V0_9LAMI
MRTLSYSPSASSLTDMPVAPYPVGSTNATLAPSSSSSDLRPELISGFGRDTFSTQMSSMNSSSASVGSIFSQSGHIPQSSGQQSGQGSTFSNASSSSIGRGAFHIYAFKWHLSKEKRRPGASLNRNAVKGRSSSSIAHLIEA